MSKITNNGLELEIMNMDYNGNITFKNKNIERENYITIKLKTNKEQIKNIDDTIKKLNMINKEKLELIYKINSDKVDMKTINFYNNFSEDFKNKYEILEKAKVNEKTGVSSIVIGDKETGNVEIVFGGSQDISKIPKQALKKITTEILFNSIDHIYEPNIIPELYIDEKEKEEIKIKNEKNNLERERFESIFLSNKNLFKDWGNNFSSGFKTPDNQKDALKYANYIQEKYKNGVNVNGKKYGPLTTVNGHSKAGGEALYINKNKPELQALVIDPAKVRGISHSELKNAFIIEGNNGEGLLGSVKDIDKFGIGYYDNRLDFKNKTTIKSLVVEENTGFNFYNFKKSNVNSSVTNPKGPFGFKLYNFPTIKSHTPDINKIIESKNKSFQLLNEEKNKLLKENTELEKEINQNKNISENKIKVSEIINKTNGELKNLNEEMKKLNVKNNKQIETIKTLTFNKISDLKNNKKQTNKLNI